MKINLYSVILIQSINKNQTFFPCGCQVHVYFCNYNLSINLIFFVVLHRVPNSILWLLDTNDFIKKFLNTEAISSNFLKIML